MDKIWLEQGYNPSTMELLAVIVDNYSCIVDDGLKITLPEKDKEIIDFVEETAKDKGIGCTILTRQNEKYQTTKRFAYTLKRRGFVLVSYEPSELENLVIDHPNVRDVVEHVPPAYKTKYVYSITLDSHLLVLKPYLRSEMRKDKITSLELGKPLGVYWMVTNGASSVGSYFLETEVDDEYVVLENGCLLRCQFV